MNIDKGELYSDDAQRKQRDVAQWGRKYPRNIRSFVCGLLYASMKADIPLTCALRHYVLHAKKSKIQRERIVGNDL